MSEQRWSEGQLVRVRVHEGFAPEVARIAGRVINDAIQVRLERNGQLVWVLTANVREPKPKPDRDQLPDREPTPTEKLQGELRSILFRYSLSSYEAGELEAELVKLIQGRDQNHHQHWLDRVRTLGKELDDEQRGRL